MFSWILFCSEKLKDDPDFYYPVKYVLYWKGKENREEIERCTNQDLQILYSSISFPFSFHFTLLLSLLYLVQSKDFRPSSKRRSESTFIILKTESDTTVNTSFIFGIYFYYLYITFSIGLKIFKNLEVSVVVVIINCCQNCILLNYKNVK